MVILLPVKDRLVLWGTLTFVVLLEKLVLPVIFALDLFKLVVLLDEATERFKLLFAILVELDVAFWVDGWVLTKAAC